MGQGHFWIMSKRKQLYTRWLPLFIRIRKCLTPLSEKNQKSTKPTSALVRKKSEIGWLPPSHPLVVDSICERPLARVWPTKGTKRVETMPPRSSGHCLSHRQRSTRSQRHGGFPGYPDTVLSSCNIWMFVKLLTTRKKPAINRCHQHSTLKCYQ